MIMCVWFGFIEIGWLRCLIVIFCLLIFWFNNLLEICLRDWCERCVLLLVFIEICWLIMKVEWRLISFVMSKLRIELIWWVLFGWGLCWGVLSVIFINLIWFCKGNIINFMCFLIWWLMWILLCLCYVFWVKGRWNGKYSFWKCLDCWMKNWSRFKGKWMCCVWIGKLSFVSLMMLLLSGCLLRF